MSAPRSGWGVGIYTYDGGNVKAPFSRALQKLLAELEFSGHLSTIDMSIKILPCSDLAARHTGLSAGIALSYEEAAAVCLDRHHASPVEFSINISSENQKAIVAFHKPSDREKGAWANEIDTTEQGAYCLALAAIELFAGMLAMRRAETQSGIDYYVAPSDADKSDLESWVRVEISGTDEGDQSVVTTRLRQKINQALKGNSNLPALAIVVGFLIKHIAIEKADVQ